MMSDYLTVDHSLAGLTLTVNVDAPAAARVDWGDVTPVGTVTPGTPGVHTYARDGNYRVRVTGANGLHQSFGVVAGRPMPAHRVSESADKRQALVDDSVAIANTTGVIG